MDDLVSAFVGATIGWFMHKFYNENKEECDEQLKIIVNKAKNAYMALELERKDEKLNS